MISLVLRIAVFCVALQLVTGTVAQQLSTAGSTPDLTLAEAIVLTLERNPDLRATRYELTAAQGRITQAGLRINPSLDLELENFAGTGDVNGLGALETTLSVGQVIELGNKRNLRIAGAESDRGLIVQEQRARELDVLSEVARSFIAVVAAQERQRFAQEATALAQRTLDALTERVNAARSPIAEQSRARIALTRALLEEQRAGSVLQAVRASLVALWGDSEPQFGRANADLFRFDEQRSFEALVAAAQLTPDFLAFASEARLREAVLRLEQARARPNIAVSLGVRRLEESDDFALVAGFSKELALRDRNQGAIFEARARIAQTNAEQQAALTRVRATLFSLYREMSAARLLAETLRNEAVPQAQTALSQVQDGYNVGRFSFLELATAQQELLELQAAAIDAAADYHSLKADLERLTSEPISNTDPEAPQP
jgi:cobalt-zinc-cadmium efflux system outer membrane protein